MDDIFHILGKKRYVPGNSDYMDKKLGGGLNWTINWVLNSGIGFEL